MNPYSIFIASPTNLREEREALKALANDWNDQYDQDPEKYGARVKAISYENIPTNDQLDYDKFIKNKADFVFVIFNADKFNGAEDEGGRTLDEYNKALASFNEKGHPKVIVFTHKSNKKNKSERLNKNEKLKKIQDYVRETSKKYCIDYTNSENLKNKAEKQIEQFVKEVIPHNEPTYSPQRTTTQEDVTTLHNLKQIYRYTIPCLAVLLLTGIFFLCFSLGNKNHMYIKTSIQPSISAEFNQNFIEEQISQEMKGFEQDTKNKLADILSRIKIGKSINFAQMDSLHPTILSDLKDVDVLVEGNTFIQSIRKICGKHDVNAYMSFEESDSDMTCSIKVNDWNDHPHSIKIQMPYKDGLNKQNIISTFIKKGTAFIAGVYAPVVPVLYDYDLQKSEIEDYQPTSHWHDDITTDADAERDAFIKENLIAEHPALAYYLLANYNEETGMLEDDNYLLNNAVTYYKKVLEYDTTYQEELKHKIGIIEKHIKSNITPLPNILHELENKHKASFDNCQQLIIIKGQEKIFDKDNQYKNKHYYKATFYTYERGNEGQWKEVFPKFKVNLGARGIVSEEQKTEGDLSTPEGYHPIPFVFGTKNIKTKMKFENVTKDHVWVCNPQSDKYNQLLIDNTGEYAKDTINEIILNSKIAALNQYAIVVGYNMNPIIKGKGSAIFMHVERSHNHRTAGCISMPKETIIKVIQWLDPNKHPYVYIRKKP